MSKTETVAVVGATGRVGREVVKILSSQGIHVRCLVRYDPPTPGTRKELGPDATSYEVAQFLASLDKVQLIKGDVVSDAASLKALLKGCTACFCLFGPMRKAKLADLWSNTEDNDPTHGKAINYVGVKNVIAAAIESQTCKRIVRISGKGEDPWSILSILINILGAMGKAWNYEGEQLLRSNKSIDYTIIRPGMLVENVEGDKVLALADNGRNLKVTAVARSDIATLCVECLNYPNAARCTLTAMNVAPGEGEATYAPLLARIKPDSREFPPTLIEEHKRAVRSAMVVLAAVGVSTVAAGIVIAKSFFK